MSPCGCAHTHMSVGARFRGLILGSCFCLTSSFIPSVRGGLLLPRLFLPVFVLAVVGARLSGWGSQGGCFGINTLFFQNHFTCVENLSRKHQKCSHLSPYKQDSFLSRVCNYTVTVTNYSNILLLGVADHFVIPAQLRLGDLSLRPAWAI